MFCGYKKFNFRDFREHIRLASLNICEKVHHVIIIDSSIKTIKKGARRTTHSVTYNINMKLMTNSLVKLKIHSRNSFPHKGIIIKILGSNTKLLGEPSPDFNIKRILFGLYAMVYSGTKNTLKSTSISLR